MRMVFRQVTDLAEGGMVSEREYEAPNPEDLLGVLRLVMDNCSDFIRSEGASINQDNITLKQLTFRYPGVAGVIEVHFPGA